MTRFSDIVEFRKDLFFGGAVDLDWFAKDPEKRDKAASHFVFHGPEYFGVGEQDKTGGGDYCLIDTATMTREIVDRVDPRNENADPISLAIAGYGAGKSHFALTLATLLAEPHGEAAGEILDNLQKADAEIGKSARNALESRQFPVLVIPVNGMNNFDLADELSKQVLLRLRSQGLDTRPVEDLWPRFQVAKAFVDRNFALWKEKFFETFGPDASSEKIAAGLEERDEVCFKKVNAIYEHANGLPIHATGAESPKQLLETVCKHYCGDDGPFLSVLVLFDEFGRYLEFAVEKPHIAGDAAIQQIFEGMHENSERCSMLCTIQYELKTYISRVSHERKNTIPRFVGRYDASKKYYLSSNLETLFAHLIQKKDPDFISSCVSRTDWERERLDILGWTGGARMDAVWKDPDLFMRVVVQGCWPFHPLAILFLRRMGDRLQQRSAVSFVAEAMARQSAGKGTEAGAIFAASLFQTERGLQDPLLQELIGAESYSSTGASAHAYSAVEERYGNDLTSSQRKVLLSVLIVDKAGLAIRDTNEACSLFVRLSGMDAGPVQSAVSELAKEYGVLEWNERFKRYEIVADAAPRSAFNRFLDRKAKEIPSDGIGDLFVKYVRRLADLPFFEALDPEFSQKKDIRTSEWRFKTFFSHAQRVEDDLRLAAQDWKNATMPDSPKGQLIYYYLGADSVLEEELDRLREKLRESFRAVRFQKAPIMIAVLYDREEKLGRGRVEFLLEADKLANRVPLSSEVLNERWKHLKDKAESSWQELDDFGQFVEKQDKYFEIGIERRDLLTVSRVGKSLVARARRMEVEEVRWTGEQREQICKRIDRTRNAVSSMFEEWLPRQSCISSERVDSFRKSMVDHAGGNLKALGLEKLADKAERHALTTIADMKQRQRVFYSVEAARSFMAGKSVTPKTQVSDLVQWPEDIDGLIEDLQKAKRIRDVPEIEECLESLDSMKQACIRQEKEAWDLHSELIEGSFATMEEMGALADRLKESIGIFAGQDPEFEDLKKLERRLKIFRDDFAFFESLDVSDEQLERKIEERIEKVAGEEEKDEMVPEWRSAGEVYGSMLEALREKRREKSRQWAVAMAPSSKNVSAMNPRECRKALLETQALPTYLTREDVGNIETFRRSIEIRMSYLWISEACVLPEVFAGMEADDCQALLSKIENIPEFLTAEDRRTVERLRENAEKRLDDLKVEGLVARYRCLPSGLQKRFLEIVLNA